MSTKNLARTAIEGGRTTNDKDIRKETNAKHRAQSRAFARRVKIDPDATDRVAAPKRSKEKSWRDERHADKIAPLRRWLASRAGKPWAKVRAEICARHDDRTTAGRHIRYDHLIDYVEGAKKWANTYRYFQPKFWIDDRGILRHNRDQKY